MVLGYAKLHTFLVQLSSVGFARVHHLCRCRLETFELTACEDAADHQEAVALVARDL